MSMTTIVPHPFGSELTPGIVSCGPAHVCPGTAAAARIQSVAPAGPTTSMFCGPRPVDPEVEGGAGKRLDDAWDPRRDGYFVRGASWNLDVEQKASELEALPEVARLGRELVRLEDDAVGEQTARDGAVAPPLLRAYHEHEHDEDDEQDGKRHVSVRTPGRPSLRESAEGRLAIAARVDRAGAVRLPYLRNALNRDELDGEATRAT